MSEGWGSAVGRLTGWLQPWLNPRQRTLRRMDALEHEKHRLIYGDHSAKAAARVRDIDVELLGLQRQIERGTD